MGEPKIQTKPGEYHSRISQLEKKRVEIDILAQILRICDGRSLQEVGYCEQGNRISLLSTQTDSKSSLQMATYT